MPTSLLTARDLYQIVSLSEPRFSPDGRWLAYVRVEMDEATNSYKSAIWLAPTGGGRPRQFTTGNKRDSAPRWSPDGRWLAFVSNRGDKKAKAHVYVMPTDGGEAWRLVKMENGAGEPAWSPDGKQMAFTSRLNAEEIEAEDGPEKEDPRDTDEIERRALEKEQADKKKVDPRVIRRFAYRAETSYFDQRTKHIYIVDVDVETGRAEGKPRRLTQDARDYREPRWLPGGATLLATVSRQPGVDDLFYYDDIVRVPLDGGEVQVLTGPDTADSNPRPSPDGQWVAYTSVPITDYTTANTEIKIMPAIGDKARVLTDGLDAHAADFRWLPGGQALCFRFARKGCINLARVSLQDGKVNMLLSAEREMLAYDLSPDGQQVGFVASTDRAPSDLYVADLDGSDERRLTEVNGPWLADKHLGEMEDFWFKSPDGTEIQGWMVKPPDFDPEASYPLILSIHGGPHVMWSRHEATMWHEWQVQAASGYVVLATNPRGSDGYGRDFRASLRNHWGEADLPDLMAGVEQVVAKGYVDAGRLFITGGSYGGFMTAWVIGHDHRFKAAVAQRGVYDLIGFYSTSDVPILTEWEFDSTPWGNPEHLWKYSPLAYVDNIQTPLLLIHSENDYRAPIPAADGLFVALRRLKREVEMVRYPRDGHELSRSGEPKHRVDRLERIVAWFDRHDIESEGKK